MNQYVAIRIYYPWMEWKFFRVFREYISWDRIILLQKNQYTLAVILSLAELGAVVFWGGVASIIILSSMYTIIK